jgi:hypothetical protein
MRVGEDTVWYDEELSVLFVKALQECASYQGSEGAVDVLHATSARDTFLQYLRRSIIAEVHDSKQRHASKEWAVLMEDIVEQRVFGQRIGTAVHLTESDGRGESELPSAPRKRAGPARLKPLLQRPGSLQRDGSDKRTPHQLALFSDEEASTAGSPDYIHALREATETLGKLPAGKKVHESKYVVRVLWALEVASRAGLGGLNASDIANVICIFGHEHVEATNVARFFRMQRRTGEFVHLWIENPPYYFAINSTGKDVLLSLVRHRKSQRESSTDSQDKRQGDSGRTQQLGGKGRRR